MDAECRALQRELKQAESSMLTSNKSRYGTRTNARKNIFNAARHSYVIKIHEILFPDFFDIGKLLCHPHNGWQLEGYFIGSRWIGNKRW
jgi:hypothetical protein